MPLNDSLSSCPGFQSVGPPYRFQICQSLIFFPISLSFRPSLSSFFPSSLLSSLPSFNLSFSDWFSFSGRTLTDADFGSKSGSRGLES